MKPKPLHQLKGVYGYKTKSGVRYRSIVYVHGEWIHLISSHDPHEVARAYDAFVKWSKLDWPLNYA